MNLLQQERTDNVCKVKKINYVELSTMDRLKLKIRDTLKLSFALSCIIIGVYILITTIIEVR